METNDNVNEVVRHAEAPKDLEKRIGCFEMAAEASALCRGSRALCWLMCIVRYCRWPWPPCYSLTSATSSEHHFRAPPLVLRAQGLGYIQRVKLTLVPRAQGLGAQQLVQPTLVLHGTTYCNELKKIGSEIFCTGPRQRLDTLQRVQFTAAIKHGARGVMLNVTCLGKISQRRGVTLIVRSEGTLCYVQKISQFKLLLSP